jgi:hypothetical protein
MPRNAGFTRIALTPVVVRPPSVITAAQLQWLITGPDYAITILRDWHIPPPLSEQHSPLLKRVTVGNKCYVRQVSTLRVGPFEDIQGVKRLEACVLWVLWLSAACRRILAPYDSQHAHIPETDYVHFAFDS